MIFNSISYPSTVWIVLCTGTGSWLKPCNEIRDPACSGNGGGPGLAKESWIHSYTKGRDNVKGAEWVGCGYLSHCGGSSFSSCPTSGEGVRCFRAVILPSCSAGTLQEMLAASKATATHWEALWPRVSLNLHARRNPFIYLWHPGQAHSFSTEKFYYIVVLPFVPNIYSPLSPAI